jgi:DNA-binding Lrp family transcriptional regulator
MELPGESLFFLRVKPGEVETAIRELKQYPKVERAEPTLGPYDVVAPVNVRDAEELREFAAEIEAKPFCEGCAVIPSVSTWTREPSMAKAVSAWTLIHATDSKSVAEALRGIETINQVYETMGEFNVIANLAVEELSALRETLIGKIQKIEGVKRTETLTSLESRE